MKLFFVTVVVAAGVLVSSATALRPSLPVQVAEAQVATWRCQDQRAVPRTPYSVSPWALPKSHAYRVWVLNTWLVRKKECLTALHAHDDDLRRLRAGLTGTHMAGSERALEAAGRHWGISPYFIAAIAGTESSFGAASCAGAPFNAYGLASCGSSWHVPSFSSWGDSYEFMGEFLTSRWPHATTTYSYSGYASCSSCWGAKTAYWMKAKFGMGPSVSYT